MEERKKAKERKGERVAKERKSNIRLEGEESMSYPQVQQKKQVEGERKRRRVKSK